jgi:hypothetical protein
MCIDYRKLNKATKKDHFPLPFIGEMLEWLANHSFFCFLDRYSGYHQIPIHPDDQSKTTFTCPYKTYAYRKMSFGLYNALASFQRCMMSIFSDMIKEIMRHVRLSYKSYFFSEQTMFFSHNKLANNTFSHDLSAKRTGGNFYG